MQTSVSRLAVRSLISLCRMEGKSPFGHESVCSTENFTPQAQLEGVLSGSQLYQRARASWKAPLCTTNPNSWIGREVSQLKAPLSWARSMECWNEIGSDCFRESAGYINCSRFSFRTSDLAYSCSIITFSVYTKLCYRMACFRHMNWTLSQNNLPGIGHGQC